MSRLRKAGVLLIALVSLGVAFVELNHYYRYGHLAPFALHADAVVRKGDIGIEGISKLYEARLTNYGLYPVKVTVCDFISDAFAHGTMAAYAVERWNRQVGKWETVVVWDKSKFCRPYPLGIVQASLRRKLLWPEQSLWTGEEATAAREGFQVGDSARFSVFSGDAGDWRTALPTSAFRIDERPRFEEVPFRVRH
jgi:hypothetical protein